MGCPYVCYVPVLNSVDGMNEMSLFVLPWWQVLRTPLLAVINVQRNIVLSGLVLSCRPSTLPFLHPGHLLRRGKR
jgi:hypothetical protein